MTVGQQIIELEKEVKRLNEKIKELRDMDPVETYIKEHPFEYDSITIQNIPSVGVRPRKVVIPLPVANADWTWAAFEWARDFCKKVRVDGCYTFPIHYNELGAKAIYIQL